MEPIAISQASLLVEPCAVFSLSPRPQLERYVSLLQRYKRVRRALAVALFLQLFRGELPAQHLRPDPTTKILPRTLITGKIEDGVGFGGIRIGTPLTDLLSKWGQTNVMQRPRGYMHSYLLETGEFVFVTVDKGAVVQVSLWPSANLRTRSEFTTTKGIAVGDFWENVVIAYGPSDSPQNVHTRVRDIVGSQLWISVAHGIAFLKDDERVSAIILFSFGNPPEVIP